MVVRPLVIHRGHHGHDGLAVRKGEHGDLRSGEKFLNDYLIAAAAEGMVEHDGLDRCNGGRAILCDEHALSQRQTVRLDDNGQGTGLDIVHGGTGVGEHLILRRRDAVFFHQLLGKDLAALDDGGFRLRTEAGDTGGLQRVHRAEHQRIVRRDHGKINIVALGKGHLCGDVLRADVRNAHGVGRDAAVSGQAVDRLHFGVFFQFPDDGVLTAATADDQKVHGALPQSS